MAILPAPRPASSLSSALLKISLSSALLTNQEAISRGGVECRLVCRKLKSQYASGEVTRKWGREGKEGIMVCKESEGF